jgi:hypothetical protein
MQQMIAVWKPRKKKGGMKLRWKIKEVNPVTWLQNDQDS